MNKQNDLFEKAFEMMLEETAKRADEKLGENIENPSEEIVFSKEHEDKMKKLFKKEKRKGNRKKYLKYAQRAACIFLVFAVASGVTLFSVDAWRIKFLNFVLEINEPNSDINFRDNGGMYYSDDNVVLHYIPMGFEVVNSRITNGRVHIKFESGESYFSITANNIDGNFSVDTEEAVIDRFKINNNEAVYSSNENVNILVWHDDENAYRITGNISKEEMIKIAENAEILSYENLSHNSGDDILHYIPEGFEMVEDTSTESSICLNYENSEQYFSYSTRDTGGNMSIDTEDAVIENLVVNGCEAIYSTNKNINILMWHNDETVFLIMGNISKEEMIKIAENAEALPYEKTISYSNGNATLHYVPKGFKMVKDISTESRISIHYENSEKYFSFSTNDKNGNISIDTEDAVIENLVVNGCEAIFSSNKNVNILMWHNDETVFFIIGNISKEETLKIAENAEVLPSKKKR